jgi:hypothetical protein
MRLKVCDVFLHMVRRPALLALLLLIVPPIVLDRQTALNAHLAALAKKVAELNNSDKPIPLKLEDGRPVKTWTLFLINNPSWLGPEAEKDLEDLYERFLAFGSVIGPDNEAVWFWRRQTPSLFEVRKAVDVPRSSAFCEALNLPPSRGPYVLVTTQYPGKALLSSYPNTFPHELKNFYVIELNGADSGKIASMLADLADKVASAKLDELDPESERFWRAWQSTFEQARSILLGASKKVTIKIKTGFFEAELKP